MDKGNKEKAFLTIGKASEHLGVSIDTLRRWEKKGRIEPLRSPGNHRYYLKEDLDKLFGKRYTHDEVKEKDAKKEELVKQPDIERFDQLASQFERPVRDIKIPEVNLVRVIRETEEIVVDEGRAQEIQKEVTETSILTPTVTRQTEGKLIVENPTTASASPSVTPVQVPAGTIQAPLGKSEEKLKAKKSNVKMYIAITLGVVFLIGFIFFVIGANSQEILSPIP